MEFHGIKQNEIIIYEFRVNNDWGVLPMSSFQYIVVSHVFVLVRWLWLCSKNLGPIDDQFHWGHQNVAYVGAPPKCSPHTYPHGFFVLWPSTIGTYYIQFFEKHSAKRDQLDLMQQLLIMHSYRAYCPLIFVLQVAHMQLLDYEEGQLVFNISNISNKLLR
jgi:hypothetical protein